MEKTLYVIMAGGRGERLRPLTNEYPKPLLRFGPAESIIDYTLYNCLASGGGDVVVLTQYLCDALGEYLVSQWERPFRKSGRSFTILPGAKAPKGRFEGTADAVHQALELLQPDVEHITVLAGDHVYRMDYGPFVECHRNHGGAATLAGVECDPHQAHRYGVFRRSSEGKVVGFCEKPSPEEVAGLRAVQLFASMGIYVFKKAPLLERLNRERVGPFCDFGRHVIPELVRDDQVHVFPFVKPDGSKGYWQDVGDLFAYWQSHIDLLKGRCEELFLEPLPDMHPPAYGSNRVLAFENGAMRVLNSLIADSAVLGEATVEDSIIGPGVYIDDGASLRSCVVMEGAVIHARVALDSVIIGPRTKVGAPHSQPAAGNRDVEALSAGKSL